MKIVKKLKRIKKKLKKKIIKEEVVSLAESLPENVFDVFPEEDFRIPRDITKWGPSELRNAHAYWAGNYVYCIGRVSFIEARFKELKHMRKIIFNQLFLEQKRLRASNEVARMTAEIDDSVLEIDGRIQQCEISLPIFNGLMESCKTFRDLCSRDQSFRQHEMDNYYGRGGQGK